MTMVRLRSEGVYRFPDGREVIAGGCYGGIYHLYSPEAWNNYDRAEYRVVPNGQILDQERPTGIRAEQLTDTGLAAKYWRTLRML